ncbi:RICIN domain-containing protein [uncultured Algibacter sp.]|uniref:RICIN domain-containing protein n=1 Tax=uncultured Algibacter sp. TaxID=298659 RepID=UPI003216EAC2
MNKIILRLFVVLLPVISFSQVCNPISTLDCSLVESQLPVSLDFTTSNGNLSDSGFTMVMEPSARLSSDDAIATSGVTGYAPSLITKNSNGLTLTSTKGIFYSQPTGSPRSSDTNSQMNALGTGFVSPDSVFDITAVMDNPDFSLSSGIASQQSGIWFGLDEDHYIKLAVLKTGTTSKRIEFQVEDLTNTSSPITTINTGNVSVTTQIVLRLELNPNTGNAQAFYTIDGGTENLIGTLSVPLTYFAGTSYNSTNSSELLSFAGIFASHRRAAVNQPIQVLFKDFSIIAQPVTRVLSFNTTALNFSGEANTNIPSQNVTLSSSTGNPSYTLSDDPDSSQWLIMPAPTALGTLSFGIMPNLPVGSYSTTVFAIDTEADFDYETAELTISLEVLPSGAIQPININFSRSSDVPPTDYFSDSGLGYGSRGNGYNYGWVSVNDGLTPLDISSTARNRGFSTASLLENTLLHMQFDDVRAPGQEGIWEIEIPNGTYLVTIAAGDLSVDGSTTTPIHNINAEGVNIINNYSPTGTAGATTRLTSGSGRVVINDGKLTIDAIGGFNTKINSIQIETFSGSIAPSVAGINPVNGASSVSINTSITTTELLLPNTDVNGLIGVDNTTITNTTVKLFEQGSSSFVNANVSGSPSQNVIEIIPTNPLEYNTTYVVEIDGVTDDSGVIFEFFTSTFTTEMNPNTFVPININFSRSSDVPPTDYFSDSGLGYGSRGNGYNYGWVSVNDGLTPLDISSTARNRGFSTASILENTLLHMQFDDVRAPGQEGIWEIEIPNGTYLVTITAGDLSVDGSTTTPIHNINGEGVNIINNYSPTGLGGAVTRLTSRSGSVVVNDGKLTIDAIGGFNTKINSIQIQQLELNTQPFFTNVTPRNNAGEIVPNNFQINVEIVAPNRYELDLSTISGNVNLYEVNGSDEILVPSNSNDTGGGDAITLTPFSILKPFTTYVFRLTSNIEVNRIGDLNDRLSFIAFQSQFTTGDLEGSEATIRDLSGVSFTQINGEASLGAGTTNQRFSSLVIGPDHKLYGSTIGNFSSDGQIFRWDIEADGTLTNLEILTPQLEGSTFPVTNVGRNNNDRMIIGLVFDPASTADNLIAYITHSMASITSGPAWDGKISRLTGPNLDVVQDIVIHLPRSLKDHLTNSLTFDADGNMYLCQGSNSAGGDPDPAWGNRPERLLSGAVLKIDMGKLPSTLPLDVYTTDDISVINNASSMSLMMSDGTYNPYAVNSPLTVFASGVRNAYDLVWHTNGWLYVPTNGTAGNGVNSPNAPGSNNYPLARRIDGLTSVPNSPALMGGETQKDWLFKSKGGSYHGHPNPYRGEYILNHGGLTYSGLPGQAEATYKDVSKYAGNVAPDPNYREPAFDFGKNKSPNGVIEYKSNAFDGKLQGLLMVTRFSGQDDLMVLDPEASGDISEVYTSIPGLGALDDPLDVVEDVNTGNIYVSEYDRLGDGVPRLTLLRASQPATNVIEIAASPEELIFEITTNGAGLTQETKTVEVLNTGDTVKNITSATIQGAFANQFGAVQPAGTSVINPGESVTYTITYSPNLDGSNLGYQNANLVLDVDDSQFSVGLFGLKKAGFAGVNEPPLQDVINVLGLGVDVGWITLDNNTNPTLLGDELNVNTWVKASQGVVTITPVARYSPTEELPFGWYTNNGEIVLNQVGVLSNGASQAQTLFPTLLSGSTTFEPNSSEFGIYTFSNLLNKTSYSDDNDNEGGISHRTRIYPLKDRQGNLVENSYIVGFEPSGNGDYQDYVFVIENVMPFENAELALNFNSEVSITDVLIGNTVESQQLILSATGPVTESEVSLTSSQNWLNVPNTVVFDTAFNYDIDISGLSVGTYHGVIKASANNYTSAEFNVTLNVNIDFTYKFNFQDPDNIALSPTGYINDIGNPYGIQSTISGDLEYGWVLPGTSTPVDAGVNARNRNTASNNDVLLNTFTTIGHSNTSLFPRYDWITNMPNGSYYIKVSVGDPNFSDSYHLINVNGKTIVDFDQENDNPGNLSHLSGIERVEVYDGVLRLSLGAGGYNAKPNYILIEPIDVSLLAPSLDVVFNGNTSSPDVYNGMLDILIAAIDNSNSGIVSLDYNLDGAGNTAYTSSILVNDLGQHNLAVTATDGNGNVATKTYTFSLEGGSGALLNLENMTKIPGTQRGFPADDYYAFHRFGQDFNEADVHDQNIMRLNNTGTSNLIVSQVNISESNSFSYQLFSSSGDLLTLPITVLPGSYVDVEITFIANPVINEDTFYKNEVTIVSNADNALDSNAIIHGAYMSKPNDDGELTSREIFDIFGFQTNLNSYVNTEGTIVPLNPNPIFPSSNYPLEDNVNSGYEGDLVLSRTFVQADSSKPVIAFQLAAFHGGPDSDGASFISANSNTIVGGINFSHDPSWFNTILPRRGSNISFDSATTINQPFRIRAVAWNTGGSTSNTGQPLLGVRVYKVINHEGEIVPNEYIAIQDYIGNGCDLGGGNCDFQDNIFYFVNIKPEVDPSALISSDKYVLAGDDFNFSTSQFITRGYPGNEFEYSVLLDGTSTLPTWLQFNPDTGIFSGNAPLSELGNTYNLQLTATDLNGIEVTTTVSLNIVDMLVSDLPWIEDFSGLNNGATSDSGDTAWTSTRDGGTFNVQNGNFQTNGSGDLGEWSSETININGTVSISIDVNDLDGNKENSDFIRAYYILDGGNRVLFGSARNDINPQTFSISDITGSTLRIIVESKVSFGNEFYVFDNINVSGVNNSSVQSGNVYTVESKSSGKVLRVNGNTNGSPIVQFDNQDINNRKWRLIKGNDGLWTFIPQNATTKALNIPGCNMSNGVQLDINNNLGNDCQKFELVDVGDDYFQILNINGDKALDVSGASLNNSAPIILWDIHGGDNQQWRFIEANDNITSRDTSNDKESNTEVVLEDREVTELILYPNPVSDIVTMSFGKALDVNSINVYDVTGRTIINIIDSSIPRKGIEFDIRQFPTGVYYVIAEDKAGESYQKKMVIKR